MQRSSDHYDYEWVVVGSLLVYMYSSFLVAMLILTHLALEIVFFGIFWAIFMDRSLTFAHVLILRSSSGFTKLLISLSRLVELQGTSEDGDACVRSTEA